MGCIPYFLNKVQWPCAEDCAPPASLLPPAPLRMAGVAVGCPSSHGIENCRLQTESSGYSDYLSSCSMHVEARATHPSCSEVGRLRGWRVWRLRGGGATGRDSWLAKTTPGTHNQSGHIQQRWGIGPEHRSRTGCPTKDSMFRMNSLGMWDRKVIIGGQEMECGKDGMHLLSVCGRERAEVNGP